MKNPRKRTVAVCSLILTCLLASTVKAQQSASLSAPVSASSEGKPAPAASADTATVSRKDLEDMQLTIKLLEARVKELEAKLNKETATDTPGSTKKNPPSLAGQDSSANAASTDPKNKEQEASNQALLSFFGKTELSGFVDAYYTYNFNNPKGDTNILNFDNPLRNFDTKHNQFSLNMVKLVLEKKPTEESRLGFRTDFAFGPATEIVHSAEPGGRDFIRNVQQAYVSYLIPVGKGVQVDFGKFVTHHFFEVIETKDNWNYSRGYNFSLGPYYHFGLRATYSFNDTVTVKAGITNGWNNVIDNNRRRSYFAHLVLTPTKKLSITHCYTGGPEQADNIKDTRHLFDGVITYNPTDKLSLATNYVYGWDRVNGARVHWKGIGVYGRYQLTDKFAVAPRYEYFRDNDGAPFITGTKQSLHGLTVTTEYALKEGLLCRFEYRRDASNKNFFPKFDQFVKTQNTLTIGLVYSFSTKK